MENWILSSSGFIRLTSVAQSWIQTTTTPDKRNNDGYSYGCGFALQE